MSTGIDPSRLYKPASLCLKPTRHDWGSVNCFVKSDSFVKSAVGTPVTRRPPHRPGRAIFPHPVRRFTRFKLSVIALCIHRIPLRFLYYSRPDYSKLLERFEKGCPGIALPDCFFATRLATNPIFRAIGILKQKTLWPIEFHVLTSPRQHNMDLSG